MSHEQPGAFHGPTGVYFKGGPLDGKEYQQVGVASDLPNSVQIDDHPIYWLHDRDSSPVFRTVPPPKEG